MRPAVSFSPGVRHLLTLIVLVSACGCSQGANGKGASSHVGEAIPASKAPENAELRDRIAPLAEDPNCGAAKSHVEQLVCASPEVSALDRKLAQLFYKVEDETAGIDGETGKPIDPFGEQHRTWVKNVRDRCGSEQCLDDAYRKRIDQVKQQWKDAL